MAQLVTLGETMAAFAPDRMGPLRYVSNYGIRIAGAESNTAIGGVTPENIPEFRKAGCLGVGFASSLMPKDKAAACSVLHPLTRPSSVRSPRTSRKGRSSILIAAYSLDHGFASSYRSSRR